MYEELGYPWERFQQYIEQELVPAMQSLHVETGLIESKLFVDLFELMFGLVVWFLEILFFVSSDRSS